MAITQFPTQTSRRGAISLHSPLPQPTAGLTFGSDTRLLTTWGWTVVMIGAALIVRVVYLVWFCPYQLLGDEAYYWEQSRHLAFGYTEKGPILAWMIALSCKLFGDSEWAVRLPVAVSSAIAAWGVGRLALSVTRGNQRVAFFTVLAFLLLPAFQANAQICTQDGVLIAVWVALTAIGLQLFRRLADGESTWKQWLLLWITLSVGVLLKQSVLVFLSSLPICWWIQRRSLRGNRQFLWQPILGAAVILIVISPMIIWNAQNDWPMLAHTLGHLGAGGDQAGTINRGNALIWVSSTLGGMIGAFGPGCIILFVVASHRVMRKTDRNSAAWRDRVWLMCAAWPSVVFYLLLSFRKPVIPSWPLPSMVPLVILLGEIVATERSKHTWVWGNWKAVVVFGIGGGLFLAFPNLLAHQPILRDKAEHALSRLTGHRDAAMELQNALETVSTPDGQPPLIVARHYMEASLYSFYLPAHPTVFTAGTYLGKRSTTYDHWPDTNLENPALFGRSLLLDGEGDVKWEQALIFDDREPIDDGRFFLVTNYRGPRPDHPNGAAADE